MVQFDGPERSDSNRRQDLAVLRKILQNLIKGVIRVLGRCELLPVQQFARISRANGTYKLGAAPFDTP
jgi:hypothetical protein